MAYLIENHSELGHHRSSGLSGFLPMGGRKGNGGRRSVGRPGFFCNFGGSGDDTRGTTRRPPDVARSPPIDPAESGLSGS